MSAQHIILLALATFAVGRAVMGNALALLLMVPATPRRAMA